MTKQELHKKIHFYFAICVAFCLPLGMFTPIFISLMLLNWLVEGDFKNKFQAIIDNKLALLFIGLYLIHLIGLLHTQNTGAGLFDIQVKLSLLVFPILLSTRPIYLQEQNKIFLSLIWGCITAGLIMLTRAIYTFEVYNENNFFYQAFSFLVHPSYISMYINLAIVWLLINLLKRNFTENKYLTLFSFIIIVFFSFINVLLSSKMGLISMILIYFGFIIYYIVNRKKYIFGIISIAAIVVSVYSVIHFVPQIGGRVDNAISAITKPSTNQADAESTAVRLLIWKAANKVISDNPLIGVGTGDAKDELLKEYERRGMTGAIEHDLNAHNEFYQVFVALGVIGFIILLANILLPLFIAFKTVNAIYILFLLLIILNFLPESMLETQAGVMFYAFFNSLLCFSNNNKIIKQ